MRTAETDASSDTCCKSQKRDAAPIPELDTYKSYGEGVFYMAHGGVGVGGGYGVLGCSALGSWRGLCPLCVRAYARIPLDQLATQLLCCARRGCGLACCALS